MLHRAFHNDRNDLIKFTSYFSVAECIWPLRNSGAKNNAKPRVVAQVAWNRRLMVGVWEGWLPGPAIFALDVSSIASTFFECYSVPNTLAHEQKSSRVFRTTRDSLAKDCLNRRGCFCSCNVLLLRQAHANPPIRNRCRDDPHHSNEREQHAT